MINAQIIQQEATIQKQNYLYSLTQNMKARTAHETLELANNLKCLQWQHLCIKLDKRSRRL